MKNRLAPDGQKPKAVNLTEHILELIRRTSTDLPEDVVLTIKQAHDNEEGGSAAEKALDAILKNIEMARENSTPICQDTGTPIFHVQMPFGYSMSDISEQIRKATATATDLSYLRPNAVDSVTGENSGNNIGMDFPSIFFHEKPLLDEGTGDEIMQIDLMLKGGGCENVGVQYSLPMGEINANRDFAGIRKVVLHAVHQAQGLGCAPGVIGVGIGGDRGSSMLLAKKQLFRKLGDENPRAELAELESDLLAKTNLLKIGPMGFGGKTTTLAVKAGAAHRIPASFFVSIAYMCWADRRRGLFYENGKVTFD